MSKSDALGAGAFGDLPKGTSSRRRAMAQAKGEPVAQRTPTSARPDQVARNPLNPRKHIDPSRRAELTASIRRVGQLQDATVMTRDAFLSVVPEKADAIGAAEFVVIAGDTRLVCCVDAEVEEFFFRVNNSPSTREEIIEISLLENIQRDDLKPLEEAETIQGLQEVYGTQEAVAERLSRSQGWVSQRLSLLKLVPALKEDLREGRLTVRQARELARSTPAEQELARERDYYPVIPAPDPAPAAEEPDPEPVLPSEDAPKKPKPAKDVEEEKRPPAAEEPVQLMLDLQWGPDEAADEIVSTYGRDRAEKLAAAILERL